MSKELWDKILNIECPNLKTCRLQKEQQSLLIKLYFDSYETTYEEWDREYCHSSDFIKCMFFRWKE